MAAVRAPGAADARRIERVAVIVPMWNEAAHVSHLLADLAAQDFPGELALFVADGGSTDGSREQLVAAANRAGVELTLLDNPRRVAATGLNLCLERALRTRPDLIVRLDCHARYPRDYVSRCVRASVETGAWVVGGTFVSVGATATGRAVACALDSPFGGHNWTRHRRGGRRVEADTLFCGTFLPLVFDRVGLYDESLPVGEVEDLHMRVRAAGGRVVYDPAITLEYAPRESFTSVFVQYYRYGLWKPAVMAKHRRIASGRSLVPQAFVLSLAAGALARGHPLARRILALEIAAYAASAVVFAAESVRRRGESWSLLPRVVAVFPTFHLAHGLGGFHGWLRVARKQVGAAAPPRSQRG